VSWEMLQPPLAGEATHWAERPRLSDRLYAAVTPVVLLRREADGTAWVIDHQEPEAAWRTRWFHAGLATLVYNMREAGLDV